MSHVRLTPRAWHRHEALAFSVGETSGLLVPALGGKLASLVHGGREWLWRNPALTPALPDDADAPEAYVRAHDSGGLDECFPTIAQVSPYPDHGELWAGPAPLAVEEEPEALVLTTRHEAPRFGARLERTLRIAEGALVFDYVLTSDAGGAFVYAHHPLFQIEPGMRIEAAGLTEPWAAALPDPSAAWARKVLLAPEAREVRLASPGGAALTVAWEGALDRAALWVNLAGWHGVKGALPYYNLAVEPGIGRPDDLAEAVAADDAGHLAPGVALTWRVSWRLAA